MAEEEKRSIPGVARRSDKPVRRRPATFREVVGEEGYQKLMSERREQARQREEFIKNLPPAARARARATKWWNSVGRFQ